MEWLTNAKWQDAAVLTRLLGDELIIQPLEKKKSIVGSVIIGVVVGIAFIAIIAFIILKYCRNGKKKKQEEEARAAAAAKPASPAKDADALARKRALIMEKKRKQQQMQQQQSQYQV